MSILSPTEWDQFLLHHPDAHLLQTKSWGELKAAFDWEVFRIAVERNGANLGAQILFRRLPLGLSFAYIPKGPVAEAHPDESHQAALDRQFWIEVDNLCRRKRAVFLKVEPDLLCGEQSGEQDLMPPGFQVSRHAIQPPRTIVVDIHADEEGQLAGMKQKTRYNIRLAKKKGVVTYPSSDIESFYEMMQSTGEREHFGIHSLEYYSKAYDLFHPRGACELLVAEFEGELLAAMMVFAWGNRAWYFYGASTSVHRERMPTYLLQWEALRWARTAGCSCYDLWGIPDHDVDTLEAEFTHRKNGLWGVYRFKRGFGGSVKRALGPWDKVYRPLLYRFYLRWVNRASSDQ
jgi:peptidoglycan pentaglycine glycine transferase (the first glycine)